MKSETEREREKEREREREREGEKEREIGNDFLPIGLFQKIIILYIVPSAKLSYILMLFFICSKLVMRKRCRLGSPFLLGILK